MTVRAGIEIDITFANGYATKVTGITFNGAAAAVDTTGARESEDFDTYVGGRRSASGTFTCRWDVTADPFGMSFSGLGGFPSAATFTFSNAANDPNLTADATIDQDIIVTGVEISVTIDGATEVTFNWTGSGAPTIVPATTP